MLQQWNEEQDYQESETPQWDQNDSESWTQSSSPSTTSMPSWSDCGSEDNIDFDTEPVPKWDNFVPLDFNRTRLPSEVLQEENFRRAKCEHGTRFYHSEAKCISCMLKGALLDQEVSKPIKVTYEEDS